MARPLRIEFSGAVYHITARGNERRDIYRHDEDRIRFLSILDQSRYRHDWLCHAYCLMSNHYHLLIETSGPTLSKGMKYLNGVYPQYFNKTHNRVGHLFQGRFKAILVEKDAYLLELARYLVLNPVRARTVRSAKDWPWSSYRATAGLSVAPSWLTTDWILGHFGRGRLQTREGYREFVADGKGQPSPRDQLKNQIYLGSDKFVQRMQRRLAPERSLADVPKVQKQAPRKPLDYYARRYPERNRAMAEAYRGGHYTLTEVGSYFGVSYVTVSRAVKASDV